MTEDTKKKKLQWTYAGLYIEGFDDVIQNNLRRIIFNIGYLGV